MIPSNRYKAAKGRIKDKRQKKLYSTKRAAEFEFEKANNDITLVLDNDITSQLTPGKYQYDVLMKKPTGELSKIVDGLAFVVSTITEV